MNSNSSLQNTVQELLIQAQKGDSVAREKFIISIMPFVNWTVNRLYIGSVDRDDLVQYGALAVLRGISGYDSTKGAVTTYFYKCIRNAILRGTRQEGTLVPVPEYFVGMIRKWQQAEDKLRDELRQEPSLEDISEECGIPVAKYEAISAALHRTVTLLPPNGSENGNAQRIGLDNILFVEDLGIQRIIELEEIERDQKALEHKLGCLTQSEKRVISLRYLETPEIKTLEEVGKIIGRTRERVRQIEEKALVKLREYVMSLPAKTEPKEYITSLSEKEQPKEFKPLQKHPHFSSMRTRKARSEGRFGDDPLKYFKENALVYNRFSRSQLSKFDSGLYQALLRTEQLASAIPFVLNNNKKLSESEIAELLKALLANDNYQTITAKQTGRSLWTIRKYAKEADFALPTRGHPLTAIQRDEIRNAYKTYNGVATDAAKHLPYSHSKISKVWNEAGLKHFKRGKLSPPEIEEIIAARARYEGSLNRAAENIPYSRTCIYKYWKRAGLIPERADAS